MIGFAPAKINLGLSVFGKRADGFHELDSYLYSIPFYDILEIQEAPQDLFTLSGLPINTLPENNLAISALNLLKAQVRIPPVHIHLHKQIPVQAGLGGGSSDAISVLKLLNKFFKLNINKTLMLEMALKLGSDCPFFITSAASKISGRGEILEKASFSLKGKYILVVKPPISINTAHAFQQIKTYSKIKLPNISTLDLYNWKEKLVNDFEASLFQTHGLLAEIKENLYKNRAIYASLSGSGSALFGIFENEPAIEFKSDYLVWQQQL